MRLGGFIFDRPTDPVELARLHVRLGYRAAYCPPVKLEDAQRIKELRSAFEKEDVVIAEVGGWCNLLARDEAKRRKNFQYVCEQLALADEIGARCCVDFIGTHDPNSEWGPDPGNLTDETFDLTVEIVRRIVDDVKPRHAKFALEMMSWTIPDSVDSYLKLLAAVDRPSFAAHIDPVNLIVSPRLYFNNGALIRDCFERLGRWIVSCHAKDIRLRNEAVVHLYEVRPGLGALDYRTYLRHVSALDLPLMLEHLASAEEYGAARDYLANLAKEV